jgi:predicted unusual protein kinase regulating ubiquinone biosynthesis (AarF/ABC1/UbiB family)
VSDTALPPDADDAGPDGTVAKGDGIGRGRLRRTAPLAALTARTAGEAIVVGLRSKLTGADSSEFHARTAERYTELLGRSKGALMKAGQMLSLVSLGPVVGEEFQATYQAALARLRNDAPPMAPELAREVLERELGRGAESTFAQFDWEPLAAASIGQVHRAQLHDGREVAVKIQYPGVASAIRADLKNTELLVTFLGLISGLSPKKLSLDLKGAAQEIGLRIAEELDYRLEASNQAEFAELYRGHPFIRIPEVIGELSTDRVLTQELVRGKPWSEALTAEQELRDSWAEAIHRFLYGAYHYFHVFNADPHPGNYLFHDDGSVSFLDFGCVKRFRREQVDSLNVVMRECLRGDVEQTWRVSVEGGFFQPSGSLTPQEVFEYWREPIEMYWGEQPFTVTPEYVARLIELRYSPTGHSANAFRHLSSPPGYTVMSRIDIGVMSLVAELHGTNYWKTIGAEYFEGADPVTAMGQADRAYREERQAASSHA